jgi:DNA primase
MEQAGLSFPEAVRELAGELGLQVPEEEIPAAERARLAQRREQQASLTDVLARAEAHYRRQLRESPRAIDYLKGRGLTGAIAARFALGYAPEGWRGLASVFPRYDDPLLEESGLVIAKEGEGDDEADRKRYDRFRDRIMFPIRSVQGEVIGFGGRVLDAGEPKYLNSPETPVFSKGRELYGLYEARTALRQRGYVLVVEGYMDVVALAQSGFENAVATLGTACTAEHVQKLFRFTDSVVFSFDGDAAGRRAAGRALEASLPHASDMRQVRFLFLPPEHDPDSYVREFGAEAFERCIADAVPLSKQLVEQAREDTDLGTAEGRARFVAQARPLWSALPEGMLKRQLLREIAELAMLATDELAGMWQARAGGAASPRRRFPLAPRRQLSARPAEEHALWALLLESRWWAELSAADHEHLCQLPGWHGEAFRLLDRQTAELGPLPWAALRERLGAEPWGGQALALVDTQDPAIEPSLDDLRASVAKARVRPDIERSRQLLAAIAAKARDGL